MGENLSIAIVGGGLAGLATARALATFGMRAQVYEAAPALGEIGAAVNNPVEAFANFRRIRIPRVHAVQKLSIANARLKHMHDSAAQKAMFASGKGSEANSDWVRGYDPIAAWDKEPLVPAIEIPAP